MYALEIRSYNKISGDTVFFTRTKTDKSMYIHERIVIVASMVHETGSLAVENQ